MLTLTTVARVAGRLKDWVFSPTWFYPPSNSLRGWGASLYRCLYVSRCPICDFRSWLSSQVPSWDLDKPPVHCEDHGRQLLWASHKLVTPLLKKLVPTGLLCKYSPCFFSGPKRALPQSRTQKMITTLHTEILSTLVDALLHYPWSASLSECTCELNLGHL